MLKRYKLTISVLCIPGLTAVPGIAQPTPQQIQQHQMAIEQALRQSQEREQQQHQAQIEQMRQMDRLQEQEAREQEEKQAKAKAIAAQEQLYLQQQQATRAAQVKANGGNQSQDPATAGQAVETNPGQAQPPHQNAAPSAPAQWSLKNISGFGMVALGVLGVVLVGLAFAAGIIPRGFSRFDRQ